jgi:hypothetical protein
VQREKTLHIHSALLHDTEKNYSPLIYTFKSKPHTLSINYFVFFVALAALKNQEVEKAHDLHLALMINHTTEVCFDFNFNFAFYFLMCINRNQNLVWLEVFFPLQGEVILLHEKKVRKTGFDLSLPYIYFLLGSSFCLRL